MGATYIYGRYKSAVAKMSTLHVNTDPIILMHYFPLYFVKYLPYRKVF